MSVAKLLERNVHRVSGKLQVSELFFEVPKDYSKPGDGSLRLFARSVERFENPILFLDQRGTGLSSTVTARTLARQGNPAEQAAYLKHFRADSIVRDCEAIRKNLTAEYPEGQRKWSIMGQSFGGFCSVNYLSRFPEGLREVFTCGGLPPLVKQPDEVYQKLCENVIKRNQAYYQKFPEDVKRAKDILKVLEEKRIKLPTDGDMTAARFVQLGFYFGFHGGMDTVHDIVLRCTSDLDQFGFLTRPTLAILDGILPFDNSVLYALIHEACYCQGAASNWSAERMIAKYPQFHRDFPKTGKPLYFTGEMIFRHMYNSFPELKALAETAEILAEVDDWPDLYDEAQLAKNEVPVYSATYVDDMYVHFDYARETASKIKNCKHFITNVWYHDALAGKSDELMKQLFALRDDVID
ncbi:proline iminopeptidase [Lasallia pustulata]|uniref:Proline iminopeptidase n=1 Tax=Lasallia pustulata TaxID=136370 RepID=A0A1W5CWY6_9LECA|nr:proline iminopeptidase [Lasallia pustulata]